MQKQTIQHKFNNAVGKSFYLLVLTSPRVLYKITRLTYLYWLYCTNTLLVTVYIHKLFQILI